jgi:general secretion pathway protein G
MNAGQGAGVYFAAMNTDTAPIEPPRTKKWWQRWWVLAALLALLPVVLILLLAGIATTKMRGVSDEAGEATARAQEHNLNVALLSYKAKAGFYPTQSQGLQALVVKPKIPPISRVWSSIMQSLPRDPWNHPYVYRVPSTDPAMAYDLLSPGRDGVPSDDDIVASRP